MEKNTASVYVQVRLLHEVFTVARHLSIFFSKYFTFESYGIDVIPQWGLVTIARMT